MTVEEAKKILNSIITKFSKDNMFTDKASTDDSYIALKEVEHDSKNTFSEEEEFQIQELSQFIFEQEKSGNYASYLASKCIEHNKIDLALNYYELAIQYGYLPAYKYAGDLYYVGNLSSGKDLKKAFEYYTKAIKTKKVGDGSWENPITDVHNDAKMALAHMYKCGEYVKKDYEKYKELVYEIYKEVKDDEENEDTLSDILKEMAIIAIEENDDDKASDYLIESVGHCYGFYLNSLLFDQLYRLDDLVSMLYKIEEINLENIDFPEVFYLLKKPCKIKFILDNKEHHIESLMENGSIAINIENQWFRDAEEMVDRAIVDGIELKFNIINIDKWEVEEWKN